MLQRRLHKPDLELDPLCSARLSYVPGRAEGRTKREDMAAVREIDVDTEFTSPLDISTDEKTRDSVARLVRTTQEDTVSGLGKPTAGVDKMAVSYRWKYPGSMNKLHSPDQQESLISALNAEREANGKATVSLWFDKKMCAEQVPSDWISIGLNAYINYGVICLWKTVNHLRTSRNAKEAGCV